MKHFVLINTEPQDVPRFARRIETICRAEGLDVVAAQKFRACVTEAINNAVEHAYAFGRGDIRVGVWREQGKLIVEIGNSAADDRLPPFAQDRDPDPDSDRGRGWMIIRAWADEARVEHRHGDLLVRLAKRIRN